MTLKVSVVVPTFNNEATIAATLQSVLAQRFEGFEVIVVNDGSTDGTRAVLQKFSNWIRVIDQPNQGVAAARNAGIAAATGEYVALLDGDDTWTSDKLAKSVPVLDAAPACVAVYSNAMQINREGRELWEFVPPGFQHSPTLEEMLKRPWPILPSAAVIRRDALIAIGGFREEFGRGGYGGEDTFTFALARERGEIHFVPELLVRYRVCDSKEGFLKRIHSTDRKHIGASTANPARVFEGYSVFERFIREHFGERGKALARFSLDRAAAHLVSLGLAAIHDGDPDLARRCYRASLNYKPMMWKTYVRLLWTILPKDLVQRIMPMLAPRLRRSLSGPPFSAVQEMIAANSSA